MLKNKNLYQKLNSIYLTNLTFSGDVAEKMPCYPFHGRSKYLIDKFYIIGYDYSTLKKLLIDKNLDIINNKNNSSEDQNKKYPKEFQIEEPPSLLNEITSDYSKEGLDINIITEMIFPNPPSFYYIEEHNQNFSGIRKSKDINPKTIITKSKTGENNTENIEYFPASYNVIFSSNPQSGNNSKKSINGFAHIFYKKFVEKKITKKFVYSFYIPICFCIISEFPYYNNYYKLLRQIMLFFKQEFLEIPIEIIIQNIVNFTISPINNNVVLNISPFNLKNLFFQRKNAFFERQKSKDDMENNEIDKVKLLRTTQNLLSLKGFHDKTKELIEQKNNKNPISNSAPSNKNKDLTMLKENTRAKSPIDLLELEKIKNKNELKLEKEEQTMTVTNLKNEKSLPNIITLNSKFKKYEEDTKIQFEPIEFIKLSGYPLFQYNLAKVLLNKFSSYDVITIFIYTFLEKDVIFFSTDLELLSLTLNSYINLNFPLNDEKYYFINACVSYDNYIRNNSTFVGSTFTTMVGINSEYNPNYINSPYKLKEHLVIDIDKGIVKMVNDDSSMNNNKNNKSKLFFDMIKKICSNMDINPDEEKNILIREINALNNELIKQKKRVDSMDKDILYIDFDNKMDFINRKIQEGFYRFVVNLCIYLYENIKVNIENVNVGIDKKKSVKPELCYAKWQIGNNNYTNEELYLMEELQDTMKFESFIYGFIQSYNPIDLYKIPLSFTEEFLSILSKKKTKKHKQISYLSLFDNLYENNMDAKIEIDFIAFKANFIVKYKTYFDREIIDSFKDKFETVNFNYEKLLNYNFKYKWYELDNNIIIKYLNLLNNLKKEEYTNLFNLHLINLEENNIKEVLLSEIETQIEKLAIKTHILNKNDICCCNILLLFTISLRSIYQKMDNPSFLYFLLSEFTVFRKYLTILMNMAYKLMEESYRKKDYMSAKNLFFCYYPCINSIKDKFVPNENLLKIIKLFNNINTTNLILKIKTFEDKEQSNFKIEHQGKTLQIKNFYEDKIKINSKNLFICYNFDRNGIIPEKKIINNFNNYKSNNSIFNLNKTEQNVNPRIKFFKDSNYIECDVAPQAIILIKLTEEYNSYITDGDINKINPKVMLDAVMNIFLFIRNSSELNSLEVVNILKLIFETFYEIYITQNKKK